jgi:hypothetical protein
MLFGLVFVLFLVRLFWPLLRWCVLRVVHILVNTCGWVVYALPFGDYLLEWLLDDSVWSTHLRVGHGRTTCGVAASAMLQGVAASAVTGHIASVRPRRRARWTRALQEELGGKFGVVGMMRRGRWAPDLPSSELSPAANYLVASMENGVRLLGGGVEEVSEGDERDGVYFVLEDSSGRRDVVFPHLLGSLRQYSLFRQRDLSLALGLRSRASEWCRARGFLPWVADLAVCSAVSLALHPSVHERLSSSRVKSAIKSTPLLPESC